MFNTGDMIIFEDRQQVMPVLGRDIKTNAVYLKHKGRVIKRAMGQLLKHQNKFTVLRVGQKVDKDLLFYCPTTNKMIELKAGSVYLGEI